MTKLFRMCGRFTVDAGSGEIVHFLKNDLGTVRNCTELHEILMFRKLRTAIQKKTVLTIEQNHYSIYLLLGAILLRILAPSGSPLFTFVHGNARLAPEIDAFNLLTFGRNKEKIEVEVLTSQLNLDAVKALHVDYSDNSEVKINSVSVFNDDFSNVFTTGQEPLYYFDFLGDRSDRFWHVFSLFEARAKGPAMLFVVIRASRQQGLMVQDVEGRTWDLPSVFDIATACEARGLTASYLYLMDFDRDSLLPFDGDYGVALIHMVSEHVEPLLEEGFQRLRPLGNASGSELAVSKPINLVRNYNDNFVTAVPLIDGYQEPDWHKWKSEGDWDPGRHDFLETVYPGDVVVWNATYSRRSDLSSREAVDYFRSMPKNSANLSIDGLLQCAYVARGNAAVVYELLCQAVKITDGDVAATRNLILALSDWGANVGQFYQLHQNIPRCVRENALAAIFFLLLKCDWIPTDAHPSDMIEIIRSEFGLGEIDEAVYLARSDINIRGID